MREQHLIITESSSEGMRWWCSCGWDTDNRTQLHQHTDAREERR